MQRLALAFLIIVTLSGCGPRGNIEYGTAPEGGSLVDVWVARFRPTSLPSANQKLPPRPTALTLEHNRISIPPGHQPGQIEWPKGTPDGQRDFVTVSSQLYPDFHSFTADIAQSDTGQTGETVLFVHGYNMRHGEAVYQLAQVSHDFDMPSPTVLFSWPSAGISPGYLYDRDSALIARDELEAVITALTRQSGRRIILLGHSMGNLLIMETLRQMEIAGTLDVERKIAALIMVSPDIDGELFYTQASRLRKLPQPAIIVAARQDKALRLSAMLTGRSERLGSQTDRSAVRDLPITVIDATDFGGRGNNHDIALTSPSAIAILKRMNTGALPAEVDLPPLLDLGGLFRASGLRVAPQN